MSNANHEGFESVKSNGTVWEPKQTGSKKENNLTALQANDKSWVKGYYIKTEEGVGPQNNSTVHSFKMTGVGDPNHLQGDPKDSNDIISIWGTGLLNGELAEKVQLGQLCMIVWEGKKQPKKAGGNAYHSWDVLVNKNVEPMSINSVETEDDEDIAGEFEDNSDSPIMAAKEDSFDGDDDDDLL